MQPLFIGVFWYQAVFFEQGKAAGEAALGTKDVSTDAACVAPADGKADLCLVFLRRLEEVRAHLKNLMVGCIDKAKTAASDARIEAKYEVRAYHGHGLLLERH